MKTIYLLDTTIISQATKPEPKESIITNLDFYNGSCAISSISLYELINGIELLSEGPKKDKLRMFLEDYVKPSFPIISYDEHAAKINADITSKLLPKGHPTPILDTQIASIAIANNLILITSNTKDFDIFQKEFNLMMEEW